jgi:hypothetical protein
MDNHTIGIVFEIVWGVLCDKFPKNTSSSKKNVTKITNYSCDFLSASNCIQTFYNKMPTYIDCIYNVIFLLIGCKHDKKNHGCLLGWLLRKVVRLLAKVIWQIMISYITWWIINPWYL